MKTSNLYLIFLLLFGISFIASALFGAVNLTLSEIGDALVNWFRVDPIQSLNQRIFLEIRLPRAILTCLVGASLAIGGVLMQGLFLNPIVEPGLIGTSSGAAFGAALYFTFGTVLSSILGDFSLPLLACLGGALATFLVYFLSLNSAVQNSSTITLLLTGIAINALFLSGVGLLSYLARDPQARSITFWNLGTLSGANWQSVFIVGLCCFICLFIALHFAKQLNALLLGETEAMHLGVSVNRLKIQLLMVNVVLVSVATAFVGVIGFIGLIIPHILRILHLSDTRYLLIGSAFLGAILLSAADLLARLIIAPAELPIGIVTTVVGAPIFIYLVRTQLKFQL